MFSNRIGNHQNFQTMPLQGVFLHKATRTVSYGFCNALNKKLLARFIKFFLTLKKTNFDNDYRVI